MKIQAFLSFEAPWRGDFVAGGGYNGAMHDISGQIADVLLQVEAKLRASGRWQPKQPAATALASALPFCVDTLSIEQWLQWIFLPRMKQILEHQKPLPARSAIFEYAQDCFDELDSSDAQLLALIKRFDRLIASHAGMVKYH